MEPESASTKRLMGIDVRVSIIRHEEYIQPANISSFLREIFKIQLGNRATLVIYLSSRSIMTRISREGFYLANGKTQRRIFT